MMGDGMWREYIRRNVEISDIEKGGINRLIDCNAMVSNAADVMYTYTTHKLLPSCVPTQPHIFLFEILSPAQLSNQHPSLPVFIHPTTELPSTRILPLPLLHLQTLLLTRQRSPFPNPRRIFSLLLRCSKTWYLRRRRTTKPRRHPRQTRHPRRRRRESRREREARR